MRRVYSNRLNDEQSAIVVIMQRLQEAMSPATSSPARPTTATCDPDVLRPAALPASANGERTEDPETGELFEGYEIGWIDPRGCDEDREVLSPREPAEIENMVVWPERFPRELEFELGQYAFAGFCAHVLGWFARPRRTGHDGELTNRSDAKE